MIKKKMHVVVLVRDFYLDYVELKVVWIKTQYCNPNTRHLPIEYLFGPLKRVFLLLSSQSTSWTLIFVYLLCFYSSPYIIPRFFAMPQTIRLFCFWKKQRIPLSPLEFSNCTENNVPHQCALSDGLVLSWCTSCNTENFFTFSHLFPTFTPQLRETGEWETDLNTKSQLDCIPQ